ncbi:MAG: S9 family peptidase [Acidobacteriaceae bacterium]
MKLIRFAIVIIGITSAAWGQEAGQHPFDAHDWARLRSAHAAAAAKDGEILYQVSFGGEKGPTHHEWWVIAADGSGAKKLDLPEDFKPQGFTHDGSSLYGFYKVNKQGQFAVFSLEANGSSAPAMLVMLPRGSGSAVPSPDGSRYAILADPRAPDALAEVRDVIEPDETSLYVVNADGTGGKWWCGNLKDISGGIPGGGGAAAIWSPDGSSLAVLSATPKIGFHYVRSTIDVCNASGARKVAEIGNSVSGLAWAEGGKEIAFLSTTGKVLTPDHVWTVAAAGGAPVDRTPKLDASAVQLAGDARGRIWVLVNRGVQSEVDQFASGALKTEYRWSAGTISGVPAFAEFAGGDDQLAFTVSDPEHASNVAVVKGGELSKITHESDEQLAKVELGAVKTVKWTNKNGGANVPLQGIATFPARYVEGKKYPFLVLPHGGPEANDTLALDSLSRMIAGLGYVVLQPEYRGSTGYGEEFLDSIYQHFGDRAYEDVNSATDYASAQGWADPNRLAIFGWSAGGFMTSWTVTQTGRYKAAVEGAGITDWGSFMWTSDVQQIDYDARWPAEDPEAFRRFSVVDFAAKVTTPLLILHGAADHRVPTYQGREYFEVLAARGKTVRMVTYPGSPHFPVLWEQRLNVAQEIVDWLGKYNQ